MMEVLGKRVSRHVPVTHGCVTGERKMDFVNGQKKRERLAYLDLSKGLGMIMIMCGHLAYLQSPVSDWFSSAKIAVFYVISGMLLTLEMRDFETRRECVALAKKKIRRLMIPYLVFSCTAILINVCAYALAGKSVIDGLKRDIFNTVTLRGMYTLWFLPTLLLAELGFIFLRRMLSGKIIKCIALLVLPCGSVLLGMAHHSLQVRLGEQPAADLILLPTSLLMKSLVALWFLIVGGLTVEAVDFFRKIKLKWIVAIGMLLIHFVVSNFNPGVDVNLLNLGKRPFLFFVNGVIGSYAIIAVSIVLCEWRELKPLIWIGENSLFIMATHLPWKVTTGITWMISRVVKFKQATAGYYFVIIFALILSLLAEKVLLTVWKGLAGLLNKHVLNNKNKGTGNVR